MVPVSRSVPDVGVRVKIKARDRSSRSAMQRLQRVGLRVHPRLEATDNDCVAHSYVKVRQLFRKHPCEALYPSLLEVRDSRYGGLVLVAVAWVDMPDEAGAIKLRRLLDRPGTGSTPSCRANVAGTATSASTASTTRHVGRARRCSMQAGPVGRVAGRPISPNGAGSLG